MATVTPNYSWPVPTSTDLVKDGATAIEALGDAIDATVFGLPSSGFSLIKTQTIGTTVSSVAVTNAFSTTYNNYKILISGGVASTTANMTLILGATVTGYYSAQVNNTFANTSTNAAGANTANFGSVTRGTTVAVSANIELESPFLTDETIIRYANIDASTSGSMSWGAGFLNNSTSYTDFTIAPASGTYTGGTIYVYGYKKV